MAKSQPNYATYDIGPNDSRVIEGNPIEADFMVFNEVIKDPEKLSILAGRDLGKGMQAYEQSYQPGNIPASLMSPNPSVYNMSTSDNNKTTSTTSTPITASEALNNASDEADTSFKDFFGSTKFDYGKAFGLPFSIVAEAKTPEGFLSGFGGDSNPAYSAGRYGGPKGPSAPKPDIANMTQEEAQAYIRTMAPTTKGYTGDYSDLDTFKGYTFYDPNFQFEDFKKAAEIAGYGKKDQLASDTNILSGAAEGTFRYDPDNPPEDEGVDNGGGGGGGDSGGGGDEKPIPVPVYDLVKPTPYVTPLPPDFDSGFTGITPPNQVTTQIPETSTITPPKSKYTASMLSEATPTLSSEQLMGLGTDEEQTLAELLSLLDNNTSVG